MCLHAHLDIVITRHMATSSLQSLTMLHSPLVRSLLLHLASLFALLRVQLIRVGSKLAAVPPLNDALTADLAQLGTSLAILVVHRWPALLDGDADDGWSDLAAGGRGGGEEVGLGCEGCVGLVTICVSISVCFVIG